jgi:hypothetical protein
LIACSRNGSSTTNDGSDIAPTQMWGQDTIPLTDFRAKLSPLAITDLGQWCNKCGNTQSRGCDLIEIANSTTRPGSVTSTLGRQHTSPLVAGIIGAVIAFVLAAVAFLLLEMWRNKRERRVGNKRSSRGVVADGDSVSHYRSKVGRMLSVLRADVPSLLAEPRAARDPLVR